MNISNLGFQPCITIYGDDEEQLVTKTVWSLMSGQEISIVSPGSVEEVQYKANQSLMIIVVVDNEEDQNIDIVQQLSENPDVVCDIVAVTGAGSFEERINILAAGFDSCFHIGIMDSPDFRQILLHKLKKGRRRLESRVEKEEYHTLRAAVDVSPESFMVIDKNRKIFFVSKHYLVAYPKTGPKLVRGLDALEAFMMVAEEEGVAPGDARYEMMHPFWSTLEGERQYTMDDGRIWRIKARTLPDDQGTIVSTSNVTEFVMQQRELEMKSTELTEALDKEKEASATQKQFINMVSHEFRTPLSIVDGNAQILQRRPDDLDTDEVKRRAKTIRSAVSRLINMMEGVLSSNMLKSGKLKVQSESFNLAQLITELCEEHADLSQDHNIGHELEDLPQAVLLDKKIITLILNNLLANAVKFSKDTTPYVRVAGCVKDGHLEMTVEDKGVGIPENELERVFERYYRATTASGVPGTGIGLNLVKDLVELQGGTISVASKPYEGTTIKITLPLEEV